MNLFDNLVSSEKEIFQTLIENEKVKIERIITSGQTTPEGSWYDQDQDEFVLVLQGNATVTYDNEESYRLKAGDYLYIPAGQRHRVSWSDPDVVTLWLALFIK